MARAEIEHGESLQPGGSHRLRLGSKKKKNLTGTRIPLQFHALGDFLTSTTKLLHFQGVPALNGRTTITKTQRKATKAS